MVSLPFQNWGKKIAIAKFADNYEYFITFPSRKLSKWGIKALKLDIYKSNKLFTILSKFNSKIIWTYLIVLSDYTTDKKYRNSSRDLLNT